MKEKKYISGNTEIVIFEQKTDTITYITSPEGLTAIVVASSNTAGREWYWVFTDHLGSITTLVRNSDGQKVEMSYDAWGNRRDPATWENYNGTLPSFITDRGYTGHEHLDEFTLINMNGRMYDPQTARFLSPDVVVADPGNPAGYNPYAYVLNNPLKYTDPSGYEPFTIAAYVIAAIIIYSNSARANGNPATGSYEWDFTKWFSKDKPGFGGIGFTTNSSFTNSTYFVSINPTNGGGGTVGYNTQYGWGSGSSPQNIYFPNHNAGASEAAAVNSIARMDRSISDIGPTNYMDILLTRIKGISQFIDLPPLHIVWTGEYGSGSIIGGVPEWWGGGGNPSGQGGNWASSVDWAGVTNASLNVLGGVSEMIVGGAGEYFSAGTATPVCVPLIVDGGYRTATNFSRLVGYLTLNDKFVNAMPGNIGATIGKGIDMFSGVPIDGYGYGQGIGGATNDFVSFIVTGGTAGSMSNMVSNPTLMHGVWYMSAYGGYTNSLFFDLYPL
jgi:RHS repeat-associated protein